MDGILANVDVIARVLSIPVLRTGAKHLYGTPMDIALPQRGSTWKWAVCLILLLATMLNYMDRLTVSQLSKQIMEEFQMTETDYGLLDSAFSVAFACGALLIGWMADRWNVWWIYPL